MSSNERRRPPLVRWSSLLLAGCAGLAALMLMMAILAWRHLGPAGDAYESASGFDGGADAVRSSIAFNMVVTAAVVLTTTVLAMLVRRPLRWARPVTWGVLGVVGTALYVGLNAGPDPAGSKPGADADPLNRLYYDLVPQWYPSVNAVLGLALLATGAAAAILLLRSSVSDFYRPASSQHDPKWADFVDRQQKLIAGEKPDADPAP